MKKIVLEIPSELKEMVPALRDVVDMAMTQVKRGHLGGAADYASFERDLSESVYEVERQAHKAALTALDVDAPKLMINNVLHTLVLAESETTFMTQMGGVRVTRSLYRPMGQRNAQTVDVVALRAGAVAGVWLPGTAPEMASRCSGEPPAKRR